MFRIRLSLKEGSYYNAPRSVAKGYVPFLLMTRTAALIRKVFQYIFFKKIIYCNAFVASVA